MTTLKAHRQISKKRCFKKYSSFDKASQFSALYRTPWRSYLENLTIEDKFINKRVRLSIHQTMCLKRAEKKNLLRRSGCLITFKRYRSSHLRCSIKKLFFQKLRNIHKTNRKTHVLESGFKLEYHNCEIFKSTYFEEHLGTAASENMFIKLRKIKNYS